MDQIFYVDSASFIDMSVSSSLYVAIGTTVDFSQATFVSGSFIGTLQGTATSASYVSSASFATLAATASTVNTASYALNALSSSFATTAITATSATTAATASYVIGQRIKAGIVSGSAFAGNPMTFTVTFAKPFPNSLYTVSVSSDVNARSWLTQIVNSGSFIINSNTKTVLTGFVFWQAIAVGEFNS